MPTTNPRISAVVDAGLATWLRTRSEQEGRSVSDLVREILTRFYNEQEERFWSAAGEQRLATFERDNALSHDVAWGEDR